MSVVDELALTDDIEVGEFGLIINGDGEVAIFVVVVTAAVVAIVGVVFVGGDDDDDDLLV